ncbi:50S ribosomal protein L21 [Psychroflexus sp. MES1-P1E]|uniref:50S ribosomal protein L21 n=1 Tax=Psychroflexus sp. MES1-P1E TaxID=2058320 RepID=UPI000C796AC2|nr:50S ribosomal protein L21 [Psychroflexus sp. MES1-P1E]PKG42475.1 50S ribosomal protein L21 [Psychroflexus sp. MES1-P1E]
MYAIVEIAGQQFKVAKDQKVFVHRLKEDEGTNVSFDKVLLHSDGDNITLGAPAIDGASVDVKVVKHLKGDKVIVFKKKRRKGYRKKNGHRQYLTEIHIEGISVSGGKKNVTASPKKEEKNAEANEANPDLSEHTVAELKEMAKEKGLEGYSALKKAELIELLSKK